MKKRVQVVYLVFVVFTNYLFVSADENTTLSQVWSHWDESFLTATVDCSLMPDGVYPDFQQACRLFYVCRAGNRHVFWCLNNTVFNPAVGYCDSPTRARCIDPQRKPKTAPDVSDGVYTDYESGCRRFYFYRDGRKSEFICPTGTLFDWRTSSCRSSTEVTCSSLSCEEREDGMYADHTDGCRRYYHCRGGNKTEHVCPFRKVFNERTQRCSDAKGVLCRGEEVFNCNGLPDGYYPDYKSGCRVFYLCLAFQATLYTCSAGTIFSSRHLTCESVQRTKCEKPPENQCSDRSNGVFPNYLSGCREFSICQDGVALHSGACPQGKVISPVTGTCQPAPLVTCAPVRDPDCDGRPDGMYPDFGTGCSSYYVCIGRKRIVTSYCVGYNLFDLPTESCLPPSVVTCQPPPVSSVLSLVDSYNCFGRLGLFPDFVSNCRRYHLCSYGVRETFTCPEDLMFNSITQRCEPSEGVVCRPPAALAAFGCVQGDEGLYLTENCQMWHECRLQGGMTYSCPSGTVFHQLSGQCRVDIACNNSVTTDPVVSPAVPIPGGHFECDGKNNGVFPGDNCDSFHICAEGRVYSYRCPLGLAFNAELQFCVLPSGISCNPSLSRWIVGDANFSCAGKEDGMYPDFGSECERYFVCERGVRTIAHCNDGRIFNTETMMCDEEGSSKCQALPLIENENEVTASSSAPEHPATPMVITSPLAPMLTSHARSLVTYPPTASGETTRYFAFNYTENTAYSVPSASGSSECLSGNTDFYPDYSTGCKQFHICFRAIRKTYTCPSVLLFNPRTKNCDLPENVRCESPTPYNLYNCSEKGDGFYPDYSSGCQRYVACMGDKILLYTCPKGRLFNWRTTTCDIANTVNCNASQPPSDDVDIPLKPHHKITASKSLQQEIQISHVHGIPRRFVFDCTDKSDGLYPDYVRHCHVFYRCVRGKKISHYCKQGLLFNPSLGICDFEENVLCTRANTSDSQLR